MPFSDYFTVEDGNMIRRLDPSTDSGQVYCPMKSIKIPSSVTYITSGCLFECGKLRKIKIPASVKRIGEEAFRRCSGLKKAIIYGTNLQHLPPGCFYECMSLSVVKIFSPIW